MDEACTEFNRPFRWLAKTAQSCSNGDPEVLKAYEAIVKIIRYNPDQPMEICKDGIWKHRATIMEGNVDDILTMKFDTTKHKDNKEKIDIDHVIAVLKKAWPEMDDEEKATVIEKVQALIPPIAKYEKARRESEKKKK